MKPVKFYGYGLNEPKEFTVAWNLGNSCNWECEYCPSYLNNGSVYWTENELVKSTLIKIKNKFIDQKIKVEFMGGEVTLKPDFIELAKFCHEQGFYVHILTNASRTVSYWERLAPYLNSALLSFHPSFASKEHYESIIDVIVKHNATPHCHLAMVKEQFWNLVEYKQYLQKKYDNTVSVDFILLYDKERKHNHAHGYFYDYDKDQIEYLTHHTGKHFVVEYDNGTQRHVSFTEVKEENLNNFQGYTCGSKLSMLNIDYYGGASISVCPQRKATNIASDQFDDFLKARICQQQECKNPSDLRIYKHL